MSTANLTSLYVHRPERFTACSLFPEPIPSLFIDGSKCDIQNISANGVGCLCPRDTQWRDSSTSDVSLSFKQRGQEFYSGKASIRRINFDGDRQFAGISFDDVDFSLADLRLSNTLLLCGFDGRFYTHENVPENYKMLCADFLGFIANTLNAATANIVGDKASLTDSEKSKIAIELHEQTKEAWLAFIEQLNACVLQYRSDPPVKSAVKKFTEALITPFLSDGECWRRSYDKPLGYPGDYQIMNYAYDFEPLGETVRAKYLHLVGVTSGRLILSRMESILEMLTDHACKRPQKEKYRIISIGSGPAREIEALAVNVQNKAGLMLDAALVDSEPEAIAYCEARLAAPSKQTPFDFKTINVSIRDIVSEKYGDEVYRGVDTIYSAGLFDYLGPLTSKRYVKRLYAALEPGGRIIIGNVNDKPTGAIWVMEYATDWGLHFRNDREMLAMAEGISGAKVTLTEDPNESVYFLVIDKPAA